MLALTTALAASIGVWYVAFRLCGGTIHNAPGLMLGYIAAVLLSRASILYLGLDEAFPDRHFVSIDLASAMASALGLVILWCAAFAAGTFIAPGGTIPLAAPTPTDPTVIHRTAVVLTALAIAGTVPLWIRYGGPGALASSVKRQTVEISHVYRAPSSLGAYCALTAALVAQPGSKQRFTGVALYVVCALIAFSWGARDAALFPLLLLILIPPIHYREALSSLSTSVGQKVPLRRIALVAIAFAAIAIPLRLVRDTAVIGSVASTIQDQSVVRQVSVTTNLTTFDSLLLLREATDHRQLTTDPARFAAPLIPGGDRPTTSVAIARAFEPNRRAGWPTSPIGEWYAAVGTPGVVLGAMLSGALAGAAMIVIRRLARVDRPLAMTAMAVLCTQVAAGGIWTHTLVRAVLWFGVLALVAAPLIVASRWETAAVSARTPPPSPASRASDRALR